MTSHKSEPPATVAFPARVGHDAKVTDPAVLAPIRTQVAKLRSAAPPLAQAGFAAYGSGPRIVVIAGAVPTNVPVKTDADQIAAVTSINRALTAAGQAANLRSASTTEPGVWWCGPLRGSKPGTECIAVDRDVAMVITVYGSNTAANMNAAQVVRSQVEQR
ncbi:MAG: hypothetical protein K6T28_05150 [Acidothermus sp.]|nr:hypothetical protein [Acidothermus sp.]